MPCVEKKVRGPHPGLNRQNTVNISLFDEVGEATHNFDKRYATDLDRAWTGTYQSLDYEDSASPLIAAPTPQLYPDPERSSARSSAREMLTR